MPVHGFLFARIHAKALEVSSEIQMIDPRILEVIDV